MRDVLDYKAPNPAWAANYHLTAGKGGQPVYCYHDILAKRLWFMKSDAGFPLDLNPYDNNYIYQSLNADGGPSNAFQMFASKSWPGSNGSLAWCPRWVDEYGFNPPLVTGDTTYRIYSNCNSYVTKPLGAQAETFVDFGVKDFGGDLGMQPCMRLTYKWGPGLTTMEVDHYVADCNNPQQNPMLPKSGRSLGWVQWEKWQLGANGLYTQAQEVAFNTAAPGGVPVPSFPCGIPTITP